MNDEFAVPEIGMHQDVRRRRGKIKAGDVQGTFHDVQIHGKLVVHGSILTNAQLAMQYKGAPVRLTAAQTAAAKARVEECRGGFTYWTKDKSAPVLPTRKEAEEASIQEWRDNL